jgi:hypothetical protein
VEQPRPRRRRAIRVTDRDVELLAFAARHPLIQAGHAATLLDVAEKGATRILRRLVSGGYLRSERVFDGRPAGYRIRAKGLDVIGSRLPAPGVDLRSREHDLGMAWLWLAARDGAFGPLRWIVSERELRSHDEARERTGPPLAVRLGGVGPGGRERLHYPDMLLVREDGRRAAIELELSTKSRPRLERILAGYGADMRIDAVLYLVRNRTIGNAVLGAARRVGVEDLVHVQLARDESALSPAGAAKTRERSLEPSL